MFKACVPRNFIHGNWCPIRRIGSSSLWDCKVQTEHSNDTRGFTPLLTIIHQNQTVSSTCPATYEIAVSGSHEKFPAIVGGIKGWQMTLLSLLIDFNRSMDLFRNHKVNNIMGQKQRSLVTCKINPLVRVRNSGTHTNNHGRGWLQSNWTIWDNQSHEKQRD